ncbi:putative N-acetylated-alpha-linked acidic dipeptidase [Lingula anatina]|uniref:N-acetylated-alpha-linked acidic dipeptidase n=1 Tax=Lingula anatina TaxID=7574 RepID=A0A1S3HR35_LINAN|nr:putative N-acetylated-alpha-linked acidic dipeptidase [Lingula anatina]|eukprot:XP_013387509.1 putative N-acetylated-alpha-linked acidic dipeptidase [Lingula anatina]
MQSVVGRKIAVLIASICLVVGMVAGVLIGYFSAKNAESATAGGESKAYNEFLKLAEDGDISFRQRLIDGIKAENIRENLREMTRYPHVAGTAEDFTTAEDLRRKWLEQGLDDAVLVPYDVLLSYPGNKTSNDTANKAQILDSNGNVIWQTPLEEAALDKASSTKDPRAPPPFNAYSKNGTVENSRLVYVNYGRIEDFFFITRNKSMDVNGAIVIARYGKIFRGDKVRHATMFNASAVILYSDPKDYAVDPNGAVFPNSWWLPGTGVQRGSTFIGNGDPLTPGYPAVDYSYRELIEELEEKMEMPQIPAHPIGYDYAKELLNTMGGEEVPASWRGDMAHVTYRFGGYLMDNKTLRVENHNTREIRTTYNAIGIIRGAVEPDRYVIVGNHRDAWAYGAVDPTSGTAVLLELTRALGSLVKEGWRPRRTIMFGSWGAEEYALIGSTEWVEQYIKALGERAVAYINVDIAVEYHYKLSVGASPLLYEAVYAATKEVPDPESTMFSNVYDSWQKRTNSSQNPKIRDLGSGSDYAPFFQRAGIPAVDLSYTFDDEEWAISSYPLYHSVYETFLLVTNYTDPTFKWHQSLCRICGEIARYMADTVILPMDVRGYATKLETMLQKFKEANNETWLNSNGVSLANLSTAVNEFRRVADAFHEGIQKVNKKDPFAVRRVNDQMMLLERGFTDPAGLPGRPLMKHVIFAPSSKNTYASSGFPGLTDALFDIESKAPDEQMKQWRLVRRQMAVAIFTINSAASTLRNVTGLHGSMSN